MDWKARLDREGFALLDATIDSARIHQWALSLSQALARQAADSLVSRGKVYGARNLEQTWPEAENVIQHPLIASAVQDVLGIQAGLVRILYFDKPPGRSWSLPWHQDRTIAVREHPPECDSGFRCPTVKYGVPHVEAPASLLERMLTLRIHLDAVTQVNGPLLVMPGSHRNTPPSATADQSVVPVLGPRGSVLAMRPLLSHSSRDVQPGTTLARRILHLEFAGDPTLPGRYQWHTFRSLER